MGEQSIGALWEKSKDGGQTYMNGMIEIEGRTIKVVCFKNNKKQSDKSPDWRIFASKQKGE